MRLQGKVAWVTGAGSGIGEAAAAALAAEGATVVLTGRRADALEAVAARIGPAARVQAGDVTDFARMREIAGWIGETEKRLDILVNNAGMNVRQRHWADLTPEDARAVIDANLSSAFCCAIAALPIMRAQRDGVLIHTSSIAGRHVSHMTGGAYSAAKHGVTAMSQSINMEECVHNIRSCVVWPGEVATPILDRRPVPVSDADKARMLQSEDVADVIRYVACLPAHVCLGEVLVTPTWNRAYVAALGG